MIKEIINELKVLIAAPSMGHNYDSKLEYSIRITNADQAIRPLDVISAFFVIQAHKFIPGMNELSNLLREESFTTDTSSHIIDFLMLKEALWIIENPHSFKIDMGAMWKDDLYRVNQILESLLRISSADWMLNCSGKLIDYNEQNRRLYIASMRLMRMMVKIFDSNHLTWKDPYISLDDDASEPTIVLEWWDLDKKLTIDITTDDAEFTKISNIDITPEIEIGTISCDLLADLIPWLFSNEE